jgi:hypothetical protein
LRAIAMRLDLAAADDTLTFVHSDYEARPVEASRVDTTDVDYGPDSGGILGEGGA